MLAAPVLLFFDLFVPMSDPCVDGQSPLSRGAGIFAGHADLTLKYAWRAKHMFSCSYRVRCSIRFFLVILCSVAGAIFVCFLFRRGQRWSRIGVSISQTTCLGYVMCRFPQWCHRQRLTLDAFVTTLNENTVIPWGISSFHVIFPGTGHVLIPRAIPWDMSLFPVPFPRTCPHSTRLLCIVLCLWGRPAASQPGGERRE